MRTPAPDRPRRRLFYRIYRYGLLQLLAVFVAATAVFLLLGETPKWRTVPDRMAELVERDLRAGPEAAGAVRTRLEEFAFVIQADVAVYRTDGTLVAWAGEVQPEPLPADEVEELLAEGAKSHQKKRWLVALASRDAYLIMRWGGVRHGVQLVLALLSVLIVLGLVSIPLARSIVRPLESLTRVARRLGAGDLSVRTGLARKDEVGVLAGTMDEMAARLDHRVRGEKELMANISHELRTPLSRVRVALELCAEDGVSMQDIREHLAGIGGDIGELERLTEDVLVAARLDLAGGAGEGEGFQLRKAETDLGGVVRASVDRFRALHPGAAIEQDLADLPAVEVDPALVRRAIDNLLDNAAKYAGVEGRVEIGATDSGDVVEVEVRDRGEGVEADELPRLFEPFFRAAKSRGQQKGTGLGLTLVKRIVEAHGGTVGARAREGGGMVFWIRLPVCT